MKNKRRIVIAVLLSVAVMCLGQEKPQPQPVVPWSQAEKKYITDPKGGKFRIIKANNLSSTRDEGIEFLDAAGKVIKSYNLRTAPFAPVYLKAKERNDDMTMREEFIWIEAKNMTRDQKKAALHPKHAGKQKSIEGLSFSVTHTKIRTDQVGENNLSGCIIVEYVAENYLKDDVLDINTRLVILDEQGNIVDMIDYIPYGINSYFELSDDLRYVSYSFADMAAAEDNESITPTGLRLYDRETKKYVIDRKFGETGLGQFPDNPHKTGNKIVLSCSGESLGLNETSVYFIIDDRTNKIYRKDFKWQYSDPIRKIGYSSYIKNIDDHKILYYYEDKDGKHEKDFYFNKDFQLLTFEEFNNLRFLTPAE